MTTKNLEYARAAAEELADEVNPAREFQLQDNIDGWVGRWERVDGKDRMVWPDEIVDISGCESRRSRRGMVARRRQYGPEGES